MTRRHTRHVYAGVLVQAVNVAELKLRRGRHTVITDADGADIERKRDPLARLWLERGDRAIVAAADLADDRIACVEVTGHGSDGDPHVRTVCGALPEGDCYVMKGPPSAPQGEPKLRDLIRAARVRALGATP